MTKSYPSPTRTPDPALDSHPTPAAAPGDAEERFSQSGKQVAETEEEGAYPVGFKLYIIMVALVIAEFLVGIDQTIMATATATVANQFNALSDVGWYGSAYLLTSGTLQPLFGRMYTCFPKYRILVIAVALFELGSIVCAVSNSSRIFIFGRAVQGTGYAGIFIGELTIAVAILPLRLQPVFTSILGAAYGLGAVVGPLIGGALTTRVGWRWCFWINLPPGGVIIAVVLLWVRPPYTRTGESVLHRLGRMDWAGAVILLASTTCLLMALQQGGVHQAWNSARIIGLFVGFASMFAAFLGLQAYLGETASVNLRLLRTRTGAFTSIYNFTVGASYYSILYFVPIYFQAILGASALGAGVRSVPIVVSVSITGFLSGWVVTRGLYFNVCMIFGGVFAAVGAGLLATMSESTTMGQWIGYQIVAGAGMGTIYMQAFIASQILLPLADRPAGASLVTFWQLWGATVWVSTSEAIYQGSLLAGISQYADLSREAILDSGVSEFRQVLSGQQLVEVLRVAVRALLNVQVGVAAVAGVGVVSCLFLRWKSVHEEEEREKDAKGDAEMKV